MKKSIGIDVKPPKDKCDDSRCGWHGRVSLRGKIFRGVVKSAKSKSTAVVGWDYLHYVKKYERYEKRRSRVSVHNPPCIGVKEGDGVVIAECRPLSKTKHFVIVGKS